VRAPNRAHADQDGRRLTRRRSVPVTALLLCLTVAVTLLGSTHASLAQNVENGRRISERWCSECHTIGSRSARHKGAPPFASIAARDIVTSDMLVSFLLLPHATMPNLSLSRNDALDIAAFIMDMKK
jgi:mono/diheme cytochrome c family protein